MFSNLSSIEKSQIIVNSITSISLIVSFLFNIYMFIKIKKSEEKQHLEYQFNKIFEDFIFKHILIVDKDLENDYISDLRYLMELYYDENLISSIKDALFELDDAIIEQPLGGQVSKKEKIERKKQKLIKEILKIKPK